MFSHILSINFFSVVAVLRQAFEYAACSKPHYHTFWGLCNIGNPSETHLKPKSHKIFFAINLFSLYSIILEFCTEHGSDTAVLCAKFQNNWLNAMDVIVEQDCARFEFKMNFGRIFHIAQPLCIALTADLSTIIATRICYFPNPVIADIQFWFHVPFLKFIFDLHMADCIYTSALFFILFKLSFDSCLPGNCKTIPIGTSGSKG